MTVTYELLYSVPKESQETLEQLVHDELQAYYLVKSNQGKVCQDVSLNVALEFSRKGWLYAEEGSPGAEMIEKAMKDSRFEGLIIKS